MGQGGILDEPEYQSVPLEDAGTVLVRYEFAGDLEPIPYEWGD